MKNFILPVLALLLAVPFASASNMKMVTYFPVPYAAYNDVSVTGTMDIGLINTCGLDCGNKLEVLKSNTSRPLDTGRFIVRNGTLNLDSTKSDSQVKGLSFQAGNGNATSKAVFEFKHDLNVNSLPTMQSTEATSSAYLSSLKLFPSKITSGNLFPKCKSSEISWKKLKVGDTEEAFLVCGAGEEPQHTCPDSGRRGDPRTWWDESVQKCGCPNEGEYYHMGACCSSSTDKSNRTCWREVTHQWQAQNMIKYQDPSVRFSMCDRSSDDRYYQLYLGNHNNLVPVGSPMCAFVQSATAVIPCSTLDVNNVCVSRCLVQMMNEPEIRVPGTVTVRSYRCAANPSPRYLQNWDTSADTRYECGHHLPTLPLP